MTSEPINLKLRGFLSIVEVNLVTIIGIKKEQVNSLRTNYSASV